MPRLYIAVALIPILLLPIASAQRDVNPLIGISGSFPWFAIIISSIILFVISVIFIPLYFYTQKRSTDTKSNIRYHTRIRFAEQKLHPKKSYYNGRMSSGDEVIVYHPQMKSDDATSCGSSYSESLFCYKVCAYFN